MQCRSLSFHLYYVHIYVLYNAVCLTVNFVIRLTLKICLFPVTRPTQKNGCHKHFFLSLTNNFFFLSTNQSISAAFTLYQVIMCT